MSLVKIRRSAQITLPADIRRALNVADGDYLEAEVVEGGVLLRPVGAGKPADAWRRIDEEARRTVRPVPEQAAKPVEQREREILEEVNEVRRA